MSVSEKRDWYDKNCNKGTRRMFRNIYGLDLGTYEIKIYDKRPDPQCQKCDCNPG